MENRDFERSRPMRRKRKKSKIWPILITAISVIASLIGIFVFITDRNLPDFLPTSSTSGVIEPNYAPMPEPTQEPTPEPTPEPTQEPTQEPTPEPTQEPTLEIGTPFVESDSKSSIISVGIYRWETDDKDIAGNTYDGGIKFIASDTLAALFGDNSSNNVVADIHIPFGGKASDTFSGNFVVSQAISGNGSTASISILADGIEVLEPFEIDSASVKPVPFSVDVTDVQDLVIHVECYPHSGKFEMGIV